MILIIACGNPLREDDGAGLKLGERLATAWRKSGFEIKFEPVHQLTPELALTIADPGVERVVFVDARVAADSDDGALIVKSIKAGDESPVSNHHLKPELLLLYAQTLFDKEPRPGFATQITVPGYAFGHGEGLSPACQAAVSVGPVTFARPPTCAPG